MVPENFNRNKDNMWTKLGCLNSMQLLKKGILIYIPGNRVQRSDEYYTGQVDEQGKRSGLGRFDC